MMPKNIDSEFKRIVKEAGKLLLSFWVKTIKKFKKREGLVTEADLAAEKLLMKELQNLFPEADFWAEESGQSGTNNNGYKWVIDPLDGTRNLAHHIPYFCVSVALTYHDEPILAAIYDPLRDELFYAQKDKGAFCNDQKISVSHPETFKDSFIAFGVPHLHDRRISIIKPVQELAGMVGAVRHMGAIALDLANTAIGRFDGVMFTHLAWWDVAAGMLLLKEAGGEISDFKGAPLTPSYKTCIGGSLPIFEQLKKLVS